MGKTRANASGSGVTPSEMLQNLNGGKSATTASEKFSNAAQSVTDTASNIKDTMQELSKKFRE